MLMNIKEKKKKVLKIPNKNSILKIKEFVDKIEDEVCKLTNIDKYDEFMVALTFELSRRYVNKEGITLNYKQE